MDDKKLPEIAYLRNALDYDPQNGVLTWRKRNDVLPRWNTSWAGKPAFTALHNGYPMGRLDYRKYAAHRVAWAIYYGRWPKEVDHINGNRADYRVENLREVSRAENAKNLAKPKNNTSGFIGVSWSKTCNKWLASIRVQGKRIGLGFFDNKDDAIAARKAANVKYGFHQNHGRASC